MKYLLLIVLCAIGFQTYSQSVCDTYRTHRVLKLMKKRPLNEAKIKKKLEKITFSKDDVISTNFDFKVTYAEEFIFHFSKLCLYDLKSDYMSASINLNSSCALVSSKKAVCDSLIHYLNNHPILKKRINEKYSISEETLLCTKNYFVHLENLICTPPDTMETSEEDPPPPDSVNLPERFINSLDEFKNDDTNEQSSLTVLGENGKIYVQFEMFKLGEGGFEIGGYTPKSTRHMMHFFGLLEDSIAFHKNYLIHASVRGEADTHYFDTITGKTFIATEMIPQVNIQAVELGRDYQDTIREFHIQLNDEDIYYSNRELAALRAEFAKNMFGTYTNWEIQDIEVIDHRNIQIPWKHAKSLTQKEEQLMQAKLRRVSYFLVFSDKAIESIPDFYLRFENFEIKEQKKGLTYHQKTRVFGKSRVKFIDETD